MFRQLGTFLPLISILSGCAPEREGGPCLSENCQNSQCPISRGTELVGRVFAGNGLDPIPSAQVFIPFATPAHKRGVGCDLCVDLPASIAAAQTGLDGRFRLKEIPLPGNHVVYVQFGRFRRAIPVSLTPCQENVLPADQATGGLGIRLPRKTADFSPEDQIPKIAVASGDYDQIECVLKRMGIDEIDVYNGRNRGTIFPPSIGELSDLLNSKERLFEYNLVVINCTSMQYASLISDKTIQANIEQFIAAGGRLYVTDWGYDMIEQIPAFSPYICFLPQKPPMPAACSMQSETPAHATTGPPYGGRAKIRDADMLTWLSQFPNVLGENKTIDVDYNYVGIAEVSSDPAHKTKIWIDLNRDNHLYPLTVTFDYKKCGRVHYSSYNTEPNGSVLDIWRWPNNCKSSFSAQERILEYLVFQTTTCIRPIE